MGRRPNPLLVEYFNRGKKINERSNRYEHTCKLCGEYFPKGRIEYLLGHLTKKCIGLSMAEKTKIVLRLHDLTDPSTEVEANHIAEDASHSREGVTVNLPFSPGRQQNFNALNVLAEASRRVGGGKSPITGYSAADQVLAHEQAGQNVPLDPQLDVDTFTRQFWEASDDGMGTRNHGFTFSSAQPMTAMYAYMHGGPPVSQEDITGSLPLVATSSPDLSTIAASASGILDSGIAISQEDESSTLLEGLQDHALQHDRSQYNWSTAPQQVSEEQDTKPLGPSATLPNDASESASQLLRPIAMNPTSRPANFITESGTPSKVQKPKSRGKFAPDRRKEVRELRKVGACMRCRMLKKVCSQETPCQTCASVETPRLWKHSCVRTKLVETFPLYLLNSFGATAFQEYNLFKAQADFQPIDTVIQVSAYDEPPISLKGLRAHPRQGQLMDNPHDIPALGNTLSINMESENVTPKIEQYLRDASIHYISQHETCPVLKASLNAAVAIRDAELSSNTSSEKKDNLVADVIDLCTATIILTEANLQWKLSMNGGSDGRQATNETGYTFSNNLIIAQLYAVIEKRAAILYRTSMHHFEQRVLSRHKSSNFETFLAAFLLLTCAERMTWLFHTYDSEEKRSRWPLSHTVPGDFLSKGERLSSSIHMMLHLRQVEPKVQLDTPTDRLIAQNKEDGDLAAWLGNVGWTGSMLKQRQASAFDPSNNHSLDGILSSRLLQV